MKHAKSHYRALAPSSYRYQGFADGLHGFTLELSPTGFLNVLVTEEDIDNGDFLYMIEKGLTR